jgi:hypothetical protein
MASMAKVSSVSLLQWRDVLDPARKYHIGTMSILDGVNLPLLRHMWAMTAMDNEVFLMQETAVAVYGAKTRVTRANPYQVSTVFFTPTFQGEFVKTDR